MAISEICCGSYEDALIAHEAHADRIELNCALEVGGLTPSLATLQLTKRNTTLRVIAMVRPRGAGFIYTPMEKAVMMQEAKQLLENGADGLAFGYLNNNLTIDAMATKNMVDLIHSYGKEAVFHKAFDQVKDPFAAIEVLIECGVDRVLTSGLQNTAIEGIELLAQLQQRYGSRIGFLAGGGVNDKNSEVLIKQAHITELHSSCKELIEDVSTVGNVSYAMLSDENKNRYYAVSSGLAKKFVLATKLFPIKL